MTRPKGSKNKFSTKIEKKCFYCQASFMEYPCRTNRSFCSNRCSALSRTNNHFKKGNKLAKKYHEPSYPRIPISS